VDDELFFDELATCPSMAYSIQHTDTDIRHTAHGIRQVHTAVVLLVVVSLVDRCTYIQLVPKYLIKATM